MKKEINKFVFFFIDSTKDFPNHGIADNRFVIH